MADDIKAALRAGDLESAKASAIAAVKAAPGDPGPRALMFQLALVEGDLDRAGKQLDVLGKLDDRALDLVDDYATAIAAERQRAAVFAGRQAPAIFGEPRPWMAKLFEALRLDAQGAAEMAHALREEAFAEAEPSPGTIDDRRFEWISDADQRIGPMIELVVNGEYHWAPFEALASLTLEPPADLRDLVMAVGMATFANGGTWPVFAPARYAPLDGAQTGHLLGRRTDWRALHGEHAAGIGQRMLTTDIDDHPFLEIRAIVFDRAQDIPAPDPDDPEETAA